MHLKFVHVRLYQWAIMILALIVNSPLMLHITGHLLWEMCAPLRVLMTIGIGNCFESL